MKVIIKVTSQEKKTWIRIESKGRRQRKPLVAELWVVTSGQELSQRTLKCFRTECQNTDKIGCTVLCILCQRGPCPAVKMVLALCTHLGKLWVIDKFNYTFRKKKNYIADLVGSPEEIKLDIILTRKRIYPNIQVYIYESPLLLFWCRYELFWRRLYCRCDMRQN
jgi:hypothetical protein